MAAAGGIGARRRQAALIRSAYLAAEGYEHVLAEELSRRDVTVSGWHGRLALSPSDPVDAAWSQNSWTDCRELAAPSIGVAAEALRAIQRNWGGYTTTGLHRRMALISARLPRLAPKKLHLGSLAPTGHLGAWTLLTPERLLASPTQSSPFANGEVQFEEDRSGPPSRAYLKLWEACARLGRWPKPGETCLDLGAAPGGWTYVIAQTGASVIAIDRAPLDPAVAAMDGVSERRESAFGLDPTRERPVDWLFCDVIAYPERLLTLVHSWIAAGTARRIVCTLKFQGATDHAAAEAFAAILGGRLLHLFANKHELTFLWSL